MKNDKPRPSVLLVSAAQKSAACDWLPDPMREALSHAEDGAAARAMLEQNGCDLVIIDTPLAEEFGYALAEHAAQSPAGVLMLVEDGQFEEAAAKMESCGVIVLCRPVSRRLFDQAVYLLAAMRSRWCELEEENRRLHERVEEIRAVARAKCVLVEYLRMSEQQAHRYIEKQAMDMRASKKSIAERILKMYGQTTMILECGRGGEFRTESPGRLSYKPAVPARGTGESPPPCAGAKRELF